MIILDLNQVIISNIMAQVGTHTNVPIDIDLVRHMVLNQIRLLRNKFKGEYGDEFVIATDGSQYWRKDVFPHYKANRAKARKESDFDWKSLFNCLSEIKEELKQFMPYPVIDHHKAEADDIIATLVMRSPKDNKVLIISGDGDFAQLQRFESVSQYDPIRSRFITADDPSKYLREHIIRGDSGDGVPNMLSPDDVFVSGGRQKKITAKILEKWITVPESDVHEAFYQRNRTLIDLTQIPTSLQDQIWVIYQQQSGKDRSKMLNYFTHARLKMLTQHLQEF